MSTRPPPTSDLSDLTTRLRQRDRKLTGPRQAVLEVLRRHAHPLTVGEVFSALRPEPCDLATVYRSMNLLESLRIVKRFDFGDGVARFELLAEGDDGHHHHLVCVQCAQVVEIEECSMCELEERIASRNGFTGVTHRLEFFGVCPACQPGGPGEKEKATRRRGHLY
jgi:Fur family transcriptional regulator, ferric uptake regulator